ncbi:hypothetical protein AX15_005270 [Amanita polypyramis BW_CC]|nr:hypothetical protein AX15_005270 [Amanita polypyramis BW_CC]
MPVVPPGSKILVSGANGFIAVWLVRTLLEQGYAVRGTVRSKEKSAFLIDLFKSYGDKFELFVVEDITKEGAFDEAVNGVDAIEHTASPFHFQASDPKELIEPAVNGTIGILKSALKNAPNVKRIVILSSAVAVLYHADKPLVFNENDWNDAAIEKCERLGRDADARTKYEASKTLAEKAAWELYREHEKEVNWDLSVINPPFVFGPFLHTAKSPEEFNTSTKEWYNNVATNRSGRTDEQLATIGGSWIHVRDLVTALTRALSVAEAGNERIVVSAGKFHWQDWLDAANSILPSLNNTKRVLPVANPGAGKKTPYMTDFDTSKGKRILGIEYRTMEEASKDLLLDFESKGW